MAEKDKYAHSLSKLAFNVICKQLEESITGEKASASFVCGGTIPVENSSTTKCETSANTTLKSSKPISIFWSSKNDDSTAHKVVLPLEGTPGANLPNASTASIDRLHRLVADCEPAGFGKDQEAVMDTKYRKAGKLEPTQFVTSFQPAKFDIFETIEQILVPQLNETSEDRLISRRIEFELYKLNVYSGPSGLFKKHIDTPRSEAQIGSLVVCLPSSFEGGNLVVRHDGNEADFDWEVKSANTLQWAAFYSDCEHEIKIVTHGHRITLTYNLYAADVIDSQLKA